ncbi:pentapeptide repeat-containing protein [Herbidospora mongoliensis]|uniref:pentapeptide repeat-containing protein n=1 Tax=Herbidospora mongoliensis TaxID=688067 RepID=UPI0034E2CD08
MRDALGRAVLSVSRARSGATFSGDARFERATFTGLAVFADATFHQRRRYGRRPQRGDLLRGRPVRRGGDHPSTLRSRNNLTGAYEATGDLGRALPLFEHNLADCERVPGADNPATKIVRGNMLPLVNRPTPTLFSG